MIAAALEALLTGLALAGAASALAAPLGLCLSVALAGWGDPDGRLAWTLRVVHLVPPVVVCATLLPLGAALGLPALALAAVVYATWGVPVVAVAAEDRLRAMPSRERRAALALGATRQQLAVGVLLPRAVPAVAEAALRLAARVVSDLPAVLLIDHAIGGGLGAPALVAYQAVPGSLAVVLAWCGVLGLLAVGLHELADAARARVGDSP